jgi:hypothetical protein
VGGVKAKVSTKQIRKNGREMFYRLLRVFVRFVLPAGWAAFAAAAFAGYLDTRQIAFAIPSALLLALALVWLWISNTRRARRRWREAIHGSNEDSNHEYRIDS